MKYRADFSRVFTAGLCAAVFLVFQACGPKNVPDQYREKVEASLNKAGENRAELEKALEMAPEGQKEGLAFLISYMPERDLKSLSSDYLLKNLKWAYKAKNEFPWAKAIPDSVFYNDVLPYATMNERRDDWRGDFYKKFSAVVRDCKDVRAAIDSVNRNIKNIVGVKYSTARPKPDQSPYESMDCGLASCSGLSVLLTDAFRSVGIPSRIAGTPLWTTKKGNHNWNEVYVDGKWHFTEYYPSGTLDRAWFLGDAGKADPSKAVHWIYASSFKPAQTHFPLVWDEDIKYVHAQNVTDRYINLYHEANKEKAANANKVTVGVVMFKTAGCSMGDDRVSTPVSVYEGKKKLASGTTSGPTDDMNNLLEFRLKKKTKYTFEYKDGKGLLVRQDVEVGEKGSQVRLYLNR
ncbi:hypothetical protein FUAX_52640 (plasmid) [Fulvitalea axinellae]|uniref:Transglutaminase-like domain-containing protein n=1 Tax=Fulvitalea axinellae TaxID=1182444 RepID=A0AAU9D627_9BACT|nr:hypothetical protein FUAX_52640 [Fulvitalea axinellae]